MTNWKYDGFKGNSFVIFEIEEVNNQTQLTVTTKVAEDFDDTVPEFKSESCVGGWEYFIKERLTSYLNAKKIVIFKINKIETNEI